MRFRRRYFLRLLLTGSFLSGLCSLLLCRLGRFPFGSCVLFSGTFGRRFPFGSCCLLLALILRTARLGLGRLAAARRQQSK